MRDTTNDTDSYLANVLKENEDNTLIYNEREKKLNYIKEYMLQEKVDFDVASHIVNEIEAKDKTKKPVKKEEIVAEQNE